MVACGAGVLLAYCILAYIFMLPPVVRNYWAPEIWGRPKTRRAFPPCLHNLRILDGAIQQWAYEHGKSNGTPVTIKDIESYLARGWSSNCYEGGTYSMTVVGEPPKCSLGTNSSVPVRVRRDYFYWEATNIFGANHKLI